MKFNKIFIIYSKADELIAYMIHDFLNTRKTDEPGWNCLEPDQVTEDSIRECICSILVLSSHSNASPKTLREVEQAVNKGIPVIPVQIENIEPSEILQYYIGSSQWLNASTPPFDAHMEILYSTLERTIKIPYATFIERGAAYFIDFVIIAVPSLIVVGLILIIANRGWDLPSGLSPLMIFLSFFTPYIIFMEQPPGYRTIGKRVMNQQIIEKNGKLLSESRIVLRSILKVFLVIPLSFSIPFTKKKKAFYDIIAGTSVIHPTTTHTSENIPLKVSVSFYQRAEAFLIDLIMIIPLALLLEWGINAAGIALFHNQWSVTFFKPEYNGLLDPSINNAINNAIYNINWAIFLPSMYNLYGIIILSLGPFLCVYIGYFTFMESTRWESTFGKYLMNIMILDSSHRKMSLKTSIIRSVLKITPILIFSWSILFSNDTQTVHDKLSHTIVIKRKF